MLEKSNTTDTTPEAEQVQLELVRRLSPNQRLQQAICLSREVIRLSKAAIQRRHPDFGEDEVRFKFIEMNYGKELADQVRLWVAKERNG